MARVQMTCGIDGCPSTWTVARAAMKETLEEHRRLAHPGWVQPRLKPMTPYRLDYSGRGRQF